MSVKVETLNEKGELSASKTTVDSEVNEASSHMVWLTNKHYRHLVQQKSGSAKNRSAVRGGGAKPYRQKGTGRARRGTNRTPLRVGGGVIFGPRPIKAHKKLNGKVFSQGLKTILASREKLVLLDEKVNTINKTKDVRAIFDKAKLNGRITILFGDEFTDFIRASRNLNNVFLSSSRSLDIELILTSDVVVLTSEAAALLERVK